ncbi:MAG TPA: gluconate 2-dehydrogenase subunit 3 family protein [Terriglobia bacterium]|nr:gluconate 2-dehydrogenase subunit 3 family protein [Terriglobia bacterium]
MKKQTQAEAEDIKAETSSAASGITRRDLVRRLGTAMTAGLALPGLAEAHPAAKRMKHEASAGSAESSAAEWKPAFFDPHQNETYTVLAERILPGSTGAQVNRFVDLLLSVNTLDTQKRFENSLSAFEAYSIATYKMPFKALSEDQQNQVLTYASTLKPAQKLPGGGRRAGLVTPSKPNHEELPLTLRDHFEYLKTWTSRAYFSSEAGMKEMGWTDQVMWSSFPGCQHPESHQ